MFAVLDRRRSWRTRAVVGAAAAVLMVGCGTTEEPTSASSTDGPAAQTTASSTVDPAGASSPEAPGSAESPAETVGSTTDAETAGSSANGETPAGSTDVAATGPVEVTDARGTVTLDAPATKVVALDWDVIEDLLALEVTPVGAVDVPNYNIFATAMPLDPDTPDVGARDKPSPDAIIALQPDLVIAGAALPETVVAQIESQVPVVVVPKWNAEDPVGHMKQTVQILAQATGTQQQATALLAEYDATVTDGKQKLADAGKSATPFLMADGYVASGSVVIRLYTPGSFFGSLGAELGLENQWPSGGDPDYGLAATDVEGMTNVTDPDTEFFYVASDDPNVFTGEGLVGNPIWDQLSFVKGEKMHRIPSGIWTFGGPASAMMYVNALVEALTG